MTQIYEAFFWWLTLWMPSDCRVLWLLDEATYDECKDEFWEAIAPTSKNVSPWDIKYAMDNHCLHDLMEGTNDLSTLRQFVLTERRYR